MLSYSGLRYIGEIYDAARGYLRPGGGDMYDRAVRENY
jgi:hypothetical protein